MRQKTRDMFSLFVILFCFTGGFGLILPITKPDGSLDVSSLLSHISLLEQQIESKTSTSDTAALTSRLDTALAELKQAQIELQATQTKLQSAEVELNEVNSDLKTTHREVIILQTQMKSSNSLCSCNISAITSQPSTDMASLKTDVATLKTDVFHLQSQRNATQATGNMSSGIGSGGATFTRWGRTTCPDDTSILYKGYAGGSYFDSKAASATILCLPEHPIYEANYSLSGYVSDIFGTEYETDTKENPFQSLHEENMPCVVCESATKKSTIMVPARSQCYAGWSIEYWGYIMGGGNSHAAAEFICVDKSPESIPGGFRKENGKLLFMVQSICGALACPPYKDRGILSCTVCSK